MKKQNLICIDKDGTIVYDHKNYPGSTRTWKKEIKFLKGVIQGFKLLSKLSNTKIYIMTNQSGVPVKDFPLLTRKRADEVCKETIRLLEKRGVRIDGFVVSAHVTKEYVESHPLFRFHKKMIGNFPDIKPKTGMIKEALKKENWKRKDTNIFVLGDRASDVKTGLNIRGTGILAPFIHRPGEDKKVKALKSKHSYISKSFLDASKFIVKKTKK